VAQLLGTWALSTTQAEYVSLVERGEASHMVEIYD